MNPIEASMEDVVVQLSGDRRTLVVGHKGVSMVHDHRLCRDDALRTIESAADLRGWLERNYARVIASIAETK